MTNEIGVVSSTHRAAEHLLAQAKAHEVTDPATADSMTALVEYADDQLKKLEAARQSLVGPLNKQVRFINDEFRGAKQALEAASKEGRARLKPYLEKLAREEREREAAERKAAAKAAEEAAAASVGKTAKGKAKATPPANAEPPPPPPAPPAPVPQGGKKKATTRKIKKWKIVKMDEIPRKYYTLDTKLVDEAMRNGEAIPGIEFYEETEVVMR